MNQPSLTPPSNLDALRNSRRNTSEDSPVEPFREGQGHDFRLYVTPYCGFCVRVALAADELGVDLELVDISWNPAGRMRLLQNTGRGQVPVLGIAIPGGERFLPESQDIIDHLEDFAARRDAR